MRISIVTGAFIPLPPIGYGAVERVWDGLACQFAALGHITRFFSCSHPLYKKNELNNGVSHIRCTSFSQTRWLYVNLIKDFFYAVQVISRLPSADIVVVNDTCTAMLAPLFRKNIGKIVLNVQRVPKSKAKFLFSKADLLVPVSSAVRDGLIHLFPSGPTSARIRVVLNPIYTDVFSLPERPRSESGPKRLVYTGRIHPEKGLPILIDAFRQVQSEFPDWKLLIVGPWQSAAGGGGERFFKKLCSLAQGASIEFHPAIQDVGELAKLLQSSHAYCYPSVAEMGEALPVAPLEAAATGLPPIVSDLACFRDYVKDGITGFVFNHRGDDPVAELASTLKRIFVDPVSACKVGVQAAQVAAQFSYEKIAVNYLKIFEEILNSPESTA